MDNQTQPTPEAQIPTMAIPTPEQSNKYYGRNWKKLALLCIVIAAVLIGGIYYFVLSKQSSNQYSTGTPQPTKNLCALMECAGECKNNHCSLPKDPAADWKTYTSSESGFIFRYPSNLYVKTSSIYPNSVFVLVNNIDIDKANEGPWYDLAIYTKDGNQIPKDFYNIKENLHNPIEKNIMLDNASGVKIQGLLSGYLDGTFNSNAMLVRNGKLTEFNFYERGSTGLNRKTFDQILSTFKFTK